MELSSNISSQIKGILILLIILGHNPLFTNKLGGIYHYLYSFHIACFFILPLFYPVKRLTPYRIVNYAVRMYCPYIILFFLFFLATLVFESIGIVTENHDSSQERNILNYVLALINGGIFNIKPFITFQYLWFLPVMFSYSVFKDFFYYSSNSVKTVLLIISFACYLLLYIFMYTQPYDSRYNLELSRYSPCSLLQAAGFFFMAFYSKYVIEHIAHKYYLYLAFILLSFIYWKFPHLYVKWICRGLMPPLAFSILLCCCNHISPNNFLNKIGTISFPIYLVQTPVAFIVATLFTKFFNANNWLVILSSHIIISLISYCLGYILYNLPFVRRFLFPRTIQELLISPRKEDN